MKRKQFIILIILLVIGFASVSTTLILKGNVGVGVELDDFDVIFTEALLDGKEDSKATISKDKKTITFTTDKFTNKGDTAQLDYKVKNTSTQYDADVTINCTNEASEYVTVTSSFDNNELPLTIPVNLKAQEVKNGYINAELTKAYAGEDTSIEIKCSIVFTATSRETYAYSLTFDSNGGSEVEDKSVTLNENYGELQTPTKDGYNFLGWYDENDVKVDGSTVLDSKGNRTLYAKWSYICPYNEGKVWDFEFTGSEQEFTIPCDGNYKFELWGAQGGDISSTATGGLGSYISSKISIEEKQIIFINVGGNNGYNGGGTGDSNQAIGGGATDIRLNNNDIASRIIVAAGGGGAYQELHHHTGNSTNGGGCYTKAVNVTCGQTLYLNGGFINSAGKPSYNVYCPVHGYITNCHPDLSMGGAYTSYDVQAGKIKCSRVTATSYSLGCGKTEGQVVKSISGNPSSKSNNSLYQGSLGGGGGYYGGEKQYAGTNYAANNFTDINISEGKRPGNGYAKITYLGE